MIGADSLGFLSLDALHQIAPDAACGFCDGCFTGKYPIDVWRKPQRAARESGLDAGAACMCAPPWKRADDQAPAFAAGLCKSCIKDGRL